MNLISIPAFQDNYIWVLVKMNGRCLIVDPGEAAPVLAPSKRTTGSRSHFTHHHHDHVGGVKQAGNSECCGLRTGRNPG
jgi:hydroxyacylglutathione hydrolase